MAYKFQLGAAKLSGSIESTGGLVNTDVDDTTAANIVAEIDDGEIPSAKLADLSAFDTDGLSEGASNLYYTEARWDSKMAAADTDDLSEGLTNLYYQDSRARAALSVDLSSNAGRGSVSYDSSTGVISYEGVTQAEIRSDISVTDAGGDGSLSYNSSTGVITYTGPSASEVRAHFSVTDTSTIDMTLANGDIQASVILASNSGLDASSGLGLASSVAGNGIDLTSGVLSADLKAQGGLDFDAGELILDLGGAADYTVKSSQDFIAIHDVSATGARLRKIDRAAFAADLANGALDNNSSAALSVRVDGSSIEIDGSNDLAVKAGGITNSMLSGAIASSKIAELNAFDTGDLAEGSNLYYTDARARAAVSVTDLGGDGSLAYNSSTGVITYTGPSATEVRAHFSVADSNSIDMAYNGASGQFSADVLVDSDALEVVAGGVSLKSSIAGARTFQSDVTVSGDLTVQGSLTYINTTNLAISDALITVGSGSSAFAVDYGLEFGAVGSGWASIKTAQENIDGVAGNEDIFKFSHPISASILASDAVVANDIYGNLTGAIVESVQVITAASGFDSANSQVLCNFSSSDTISLPAASDAQGKIYKFKKIGSGNVVIQCDAGNGETIDGETSITLESAFAGVSIISDGVRFYVM